LVAAARIWSMRIPLTVRKKPSGIDDASLTAAERPHTVEKGL